MASIFDKSIEKLAELILSSNKIVIFTGAGVSTESGIPDFRSPGGIWERHDPEMFTLQRFLNDVEARKLHWKALLQDDFIPHTGVSPNAAHYAGAELEKIGKLDCVVTQNVDGLHEEAGNSPEKVFHVHGTLERAICLECGNYYSMDELREWMEQGTEIPECGKCGGLLKPDAIFFGEALPEKVLSESQRRAQNCDLCIVIGSSLVVYPAALIPRYAVQSGARLAIINRDRTDLDSHADVCIYNSAGETMSAVMEIVRSKL
ncbi:MAG: NAD-dependent deacylase [Dehalococcoidia bacterium]